MHQPNLSELTDEELLREAKKRRTNSLISAVLIGVCIGIIVYSVLKSTWGIFTLIPIFFAYKLINKPRYNSQDLENLLKERKLR
jgi:F0F1-type ATP synthase assembly protein I